MEDSVCGFRNEGDFPSEAELVHRLLDPPIYLNGVVGEDLLDFWRADIRSREEDREVLVPVR